MHFRLVLVMLSEVAVDWVKHGFVAKFNLIYADVYAKFRNVLCRDLAARSASGVSVECFSAFVESLLVLHLF